MRDLIGRISRYIIQKLPVFVILYGGLGNQLYIFSAAYAYSRRHSRKLYLIDFWYTGRQKRRQGLDRFRRDAELIGLLPKGAFVRPGLSLQAVIYYAARVLVRVNFLGGLAHIERDPNQPSGVAKPYAVLLNGLFQDPALFHEYACDLRKILVPLQIVDGRSGVNNQIMCHIRLGDNLVSGNDESGVLAPDYYREVLSEYFYGNDQEVNYFSDSNDIASLKFGIPLDLFDKSPSLQEAFYRMVGCKHYIIGNSTLSWWAAYLGAEDDSVVILPEPFYWRRKDNISSSAKYLKGCTIKRAMFLNEQGDVREISEKV